MAAYDAPHSLIEFSCFQTQTASESVSSLWNPWVQLFVCENAALIVRLSRFFASSSSDVLEKLPSELAGEWGDFFVEGVYNLLLPLPVKITGMYVCFSTVSFYFLQISCAKCILLALALWLQILIPILLEVPLLYVTLTF